MNETETSGYGSSESGSSGYSTTGAGSGYGGESASLSGSGYGSSERTENRYHRNPYQAPLFDNPLAENPYDQSSLVGNSGSSSSGYYQAPVQETADSSGSQFGW